LLQLTTVYLFKAKSFVMTIQEFALSEPPLPNEFAGLPCTAYFLRDVLLKRPYLQAAWCLQALRSPLRREIQLCGRIRQWVYIEASQRYLRVVTLEDGTTLHNAFFDRRFTP
jgi:hypothetical protein